MINARFEDLTTQVANVDSVASSNKRNFEREVKDLSAQVSALSKRINKAEYDRMSKYYKAVGELADWRIKIT